MLSGYDPYAGYYNQDGTSYAYDPNTYTAPATAAAPAQAGATAHTATEAAADPAAAAPTVAVPLTATAVASADATLTSTPADATAKPATLTAEQTAAATQEIGADHAANLLSVDEKQNLEQQQEAAETARKEAEERYQKAEEQRRNAKVTCTTFMLSLLLAHVHIHKTCIHVGMRTARTCMYIFHISASCRCPQCCTKLLFTSTV